MQVKVVGFFLSLKPNMNNKQSIRYQQQASRSGSDHNTGHGETN